MLLCMCAFMSTHVCERMLTACRHLSSSVHAASAALALTAPVKPCPHACVGAHACTYRHAHACVHVCICACVHVCMRVRACVCVRACICACVFRVHALGAHTSSSNGLCSCRRALLARLRAALHVRRSVMRSSVLPVSASFIIIIFIAIMSSLIILSSPGVNFLQIHRKACTPFAAHLEAAAKMCKSDARFGCSSQSHCKRSGISSADEVTVQALVQPMKLPPRH